MQEGEEAEVKIDLVRFETRVRKILEDSVIICNPLPQMEDLSDLIHITI